MLADGCCDGAATALMAIIYRRRANFIRENGQSIRKRTRQIVNFKKDDEERCCKQEALQRRDFEVGGG